MTSQIIIVCDTQQEANVAVEVCKQRGYAVVNIAQPQQIQLLEVENTQPNYTFTGKYARMAPALWVVTAEK